MIVSKFLMTGIPAAALIACTPFLHAAPQEEADIPSMTRTWTNKETGATFQARLAGLNSVNAIHEKENPLSPQKTFQGGPGLD